MHKIVFLELICNSTKIVAKFIISNIKVVVHLILTVYSVLSLALKLNFEQLSIVSPEKNLICNLYSTNENYQIFLIAS